MPPTWLWKTAHFILMNQPKEFSCSLFLLFCPHGRELDSLMDTIILTLIDSNKLVGVKFHSPLTMITSTSSKFWGEVWLYHGGSFFLWPGKSQLIKTHLMFPRPPTCKVDVASLDHMILTVVFLFVTSLSTWCWISNSLLMVLAKFETLVSWRSLPKLFCLFLVRATAHSPTPHFAHSSLFPNLFVTLCLRATPTSLSFSSSVVLQLKQLKDIQKF